MSTPAPTQSTAAEGHMAAAMRNPTVVGAAVLVLAALGYMGIIGPAADARAEAERARYSLIAESLSAMDYRLQRIEEELQRTSYARWSAADMQVWVAEMRARHPDIDWVQPIPAGGPSR